VTNSILEETTSVVQLQLLLWQTVCKCLVVLGVFKSLGVAICDVQVVTFFDMILKWKEGQGLQKEEFYFGFSPFKKKRILLNLKDPVRTAQ
jgi:hypothetical protein